MRSNGVKNGKRHFQSPSIEESVRKRYALGASRMQKELCCPVDYDPQYLKVIPKEILEKDYGCGDPSQFLKEGDVVLDLGSGAGKIGYIASQIVGPKGKVIGVDFNPVMLRLAKKYQKEMGKRIGWDNVEFLWGKIQDLRTNLERLEKDLKRRPLRSAKDFHAYEAKQTQVRMKDPLVSDDSIDIIVSNCVLNLVRPEDKVQLFHEMFRVLKRGGRVAISDIVSDEVVPEDLRKDPELWSGCISGAFQEKEFLQAFEEAGFYGIQIAKREERPWRTVRGIEFRSITVTAYKGKEGTCLERNQAVVYKGPWRQVIDDDQHVLKRGRRTAVCDKTYHLYSKEPYQKDLILISPRKNIPLSKAKTFDCHRNAERHPRETKGMSYRATKAATSDCEDSSCC